MYYIGFDIAKENHYASIANSNGEVIQEAFLVKNSNNGFNYFMEKLKEHNINISDCLVGMESTGHYGENLIQFLHNKGFNLGIINPIQTDALRNSNIRKTKTDKIDTYLIIQSLMLKHYTPFVAKDIKILELRSLCRHRDDVLKYRTKLKVRLVAFVDQLFPELNLIFNSIHSKSCYAILSTYTSPKNIASVRVDAIANLLKKASQGRFSLEKAQQLKELAKSSIGVKNSSLSIQIKHSLKQIELLDDQIKELDLEIKRIMDELKSVILTIPGISYTLGAIIVSEIGNIDKFASPTKLLAFEGLDPSVKQSGNFNATTIKMSKRGSKLLRYAILKASGLIIWNSETFNIYYNRKLTQGKSHNNAVCHVGHKLTRVIFHMLKENIEFKEQLEN
jgi:transposase